MGLGSFSFLSPLVIVVSSVPSMLFFVRMHLSYIYSRFLSIVSFTLFFCLFHFPSPFCQLSLSPDSVW